MWWKKSRELMVTKLSMIFVSFLVIAIASTAFNYSRMRSSFVLSTNKVSSFVPINTNTTLTEKFIHWKLSISKRKLKISQTFFPLLFYVLFHGVDFSPIRQNTMTFSLVCWEYFWRRCRWYRCRVIRTFSSLWHWYCNDDEFCNSIFVSNSLSLIEGARAGKFE